MKARYREPYNARRASVSWNLMVGEDPLWVAKQHGHSVQTMLKTYAAWLEGTTEADLRAIQKAMEVPATSALTASASSIDATLPDDVPISQPALSIGK
jgi:flavorubredoxin